VTADDRRIVLAFVGRDCARWCRISANVPSAFGLPGRVCYACGVGRLDLLD
jgi:hypothetical protein